MSELTENQKLVKLGLRSPNNTESAGKDAIEKLKKQIGENFDRFQELFEDANIASLSDFETFLENNGLSSSTAKNIRKVVNNKYGDISTFKNKIVSEFNSFEDFLNDFQSNPGLRSGRETEDGQSAGGITVYEESGVGRNGQSIPAGGVEVFGNEVHFSEAGAVKDTKDESSGSSDPIVWSNLSVSPTGIRLGSTATVSADVTNNTNSRRGVVAQLIEDGTVIQSKSVDVLDNGIETVSFEYEGDSRGTFDVGISEAGTQTVRVISGGL